MIPELIKLAVVELSKGVEIGKPAKFKWQRLLIAWLCLMMIAGSNGQDFAENHLAHLPFLTSTASDVGDYDGDGWLDLLVTGAAVGAPGLATILTNRNGDLFESGISFDEVQHGDARFVDIDNDNDLDVFLCGNRAERPDLFAELYENVGGEFRKLPVDFPGVDFGACDWGDYDGDGLPDLIYTGQGVDKPGETHLFRNLGNRTFAEVRPGFPASRGAVRWLDADADGDLDLLLIDMSTGLPHTVMFRNNFDGTFSEVSSSFPPFFGSIAIADVNNDGKVDLLLVGSTPSGPVANVYTNEGNFQFSAAAELPGVIAGSSSQPGQLFGDYDNNGYPDFVIAGLTSSVFKGLSAVYRNQNGTFQRLNFEPISQGGTVSWGDFNNDRRLDLVFFSEEGLRGTLYLNQTSRSNTPPEAPSNLRTSQLQGVTVFSWDAAFDTNQDGGLSYNLRIGSRPGASDILSPMADLKSGKRTICRPGNAGWSGMWKMRLGPGRYYWSVQAVDHGYEGSVWAAENEFEVGPKIAGIDLGLVRTEPFAAEVSAIISTNGPETVFWVEYGERSDYGNKTEVQAINADTENKVILNNLNPATEYHYRFVARNGVGTNYSTDAIFRTFMFDIGGEQLPATPAEQMAWGDYDNDGDLDVLVMVEGWKSATLFRNDRGSFTRMTNTFPPFAYSTAGWGDLDNDNDLDLIMTGRDQFQPQIAIYRNDSGSLEQVTARGLDGSVLGWISWGDYDNDGLLDVALTGISSFALPRGTRLYRNLGQYNFEDHGIRLDAADLTPEWGDVDGDYDLDFLDAGSFYSNNSSSFARVFSPMTGDGFGSAWADLDQDGDLDVAIPSRGIYLFQNGELFEALPLPLMSQNSQAIASDFDANGSTDVAFVGRDSSLYLNTGGTFRAVGPLGVKSDFSAVVTAADIDNDGRVDLALIRSNAVTVARNLSPAVLPVPAPPYNLTVVQTNAGLLFTWQSPTNNRPLELTYNVRVGTAPGLSDLVSPMADPVTGFRRVPRPGNAGINRGFFLQRTAAGKVYWSVQGINSALVGGPFAPEANFTSLGSVDRPLLSVETSSNSQFVLSVATVPGAAYVVQGSSDLTTWTSLTNFVGHGDSSIYREATTTPHRFFRASAFSLFVAKSVNRVHARGTPGR